MIIKLNNNLKIYYTFAILILVLYLNDLFKVPSYFAINYDSEPEYLAESIGYSIHGYFVDFFHPGISIKIIGSLLYNIFKFKLIDDFIQCYRIIIFLIGFIIIKIYTINISLAATVFVFLYSFSLPLNFQLLGVVSPHWISLAVALYLYKYSIDCLNLEKNIKINFIKLVVLTNLSLLTKFTFVLMIFPIMILILFRVLLYERHFIKFLSGILFINIIVAIPILLFAPVYFVVHLGGNAKIITNCLILSSISILLLYKFYLFVKLNSFNLQIFYINIVKFTSLVIVIYVVFTSVINEQYPSDLTGRNLSFIGVLAYVWFENIKINVKMKKIMITLMALISIIFMINTSKSLREAENLYFHINKNFEDNISKIIEDKNIETVLLLPTGKFISQKYFNAWADYRYGARLYNLKIKSNFELKGNYFYIINSRKFELEKIPSDGKLIIRYLKILVSTSIGKMIGWPQQILNDQSGKDICEETYDYFHHENYLVIRQNINSNNDAKDLIDLRDKLMYKCNLNVSSITKFNDNYSSIDYFLVNNKF